MDTNRCSYASAPVEVQVDLALLREVLWRAAVRAGHTFEALERDPDEVEWTGHRTRFVYRYGTFTVAVRGGRATVIECRGSAAILYRDDGAAVAAVADEYGAPIDALAAALRLPPAARPDLN
jgi:hypothetical protein